MICKFKNWIRRLLFDLLKEDIQALIDQSKPEIKKSEWEVLTEPLIIDRPRASSVVWQDHKGRPGHLLVKYATGPRGQHKKVCIKAPEQFPENMTEWLLARPEAFI